MPGTVDEHVRGLDVQMQHPVGVRVGEGLDECVCHAGGFVVGERVAVYPGQELGEVHAVDVLHYQVGVGCVKGEVQDRHDVGMGEHAGRARLGEGRRHGLGGNAGPVGGERDALDGHAPLEATVQADLDGAKTAGGPRLEGAVPAEQG